MGHVPKVNAGGSAMRITILLVLLLLLPSVGFCAPPAPVLARSVSLNLYQVKLADFARVVFGDLLLKNYTFDSEIIKNAEEISVNWNSVSLSSVDEMTREIFSSRGFDFVQVGKVLMLGKRKIIEEEKGVLIYKPRFRRRAISPTFWQRSLTRTSSARAACPPRPDSERPL